MSEDETDPTPKKIKAGEFLGKANQARESVTSVADAANNAFGAIKWVAIAICLGLIVFTGFSVYKLVTAPARMGETAPDTIKERMFWTAHFGGHENKVCQLSMSFGEAELPVFIAADNKGYATSKSLGSKNDRLMRILIRADGDDLALNTEWDNDAAGVENVGSKVRKTLVQILTIKFDYAHIVKYETISFDAYWIANLWTFTLTLWFIQPQ